jgi:hypothetical protein
VGAGYLEFVTSEIVKGINSTSGPGEIKILTVITEPFTNLIIQVSDELNAFVVKPLNVSNFTAGQKCTKSMGP